MKLIICLAALVVTSAAMAQDSSTGSGVPASPTSSVGPGATLPANSQPIAISDPGLLFSKAKEFADQLKTQTMDFIGLLWLVALLYAAWQAQIRGYQELIEPFLRVMFALVLLDNYTDLAAALMDAVKQLSASLPNQGANGKWFGGASIGLSGSLASVLMTGSVSVIAIIIGVAIAALLIGVAMGMQILLKACLIALGPLAIACITFRHTSGIFTAWLKTFIALCLIPLGWNIGAGLAVALIAPNASGSLLGNAGATVGAAALLVPIAVSVYFGMPALVLWVVNKASGIAGTAFPSPIQQTANWLGASAALKGGGGTRGVQVTEQLASKADGSAVSATYTMGGDSLYSKIMSGFGSSHPMTSAMRQRICAASVIHQQHQQNS